KLLNLATQRLRWLVRVQRDHVPRTRRLQNTRRRFRVGKTDKEYRVLWIFDHAPCENIGERFGSHHSAGKRVKPAPASRRVANGLAIENEGSDFLHQLQPGQQPASGDGAA